MDPLPQERPGVMSGTARTVESAVSAVSWPAILAGAFVAAATTIVLMALGSGLGLASVSPWPDKGASATTFVALTAVWLIVVQWLSAGVGGYLTGRLRTKWAGTHTHEVFFRDTAHGFITWSVATVAVVGFLTSATTALLGSGIHAASSVAAGATQGAASSAARGAMAPGSGSPEYGSAIAPYDVDLLFRSARPDGNSTARDAHAEAAQILARDLIHGTGDVPANDRNYLAELVAARTGISQDEARKRVDEVIAQVKADEVKAREMADAAHKAAAAASIFAALSMVTGAFIACIAAALGGHRRDEHP